MDRQKFLLNIVFILIVGLSYILIISNSVFIYDSPDEKMKIIIAESDTYPHEGVNKTIIEADCNNDSNEEYYLAEETNNKYVSNKTPKENITGYTKIYKTDHRDQIYNCIDTLNIDTSKDQKHYVVVKELTLPL